MRSFRSNPYRILDYQRAKCEAQVAPERTVDYKPFALMKMRVEK